MVARHPYTRAHAPVPLRSAHRARVGFVRDLAAVTRLAAARRQLATSLRVVRAVLRNPALRRVELAFLLYTGVEFGTWVAILLYAYDVSGPAAVGVVALAQLLPAAFFAPVAASLADRFPRDRVLLAAYLAQALAFGLTGIGMVTGAPATLVYVGAAAGVSLLTITRPAQGSLLPTLARTPEELTAANGLSGTVEGAGVLLGPLAAAAILAVASPGAVFVVGGLACLAAAALVVRLPRRPRAPLVAADPHEGLESHDGHEPRGVEGAIGALRILASSADSRLVVGLLAIRMLTSGAMDVLFVLLALELFLTGESGAGILNAGLGLGTVLGGAASFVLVGRQRLAPALAISALAWGAAIVAVGTVATAWVAPALIALGGIGYAATDVAGRTILQRVTPDRMLGRVLGTLEGIGLVGLSVGSILVPVIAAAVGLQATLIVVGLTLPVAVALSWAGLRSIDRRVHVPVREVALLRQTPVFSPLPAPQLEAVARHTRWITLESGDVLIREGDHGDRYYVTETGVLRVTQGGRHLRDTDPGEGLGEIALLRDVPRTATVTALEPCVLLALERADFLEAITGHELAHEVAERIAGERTSEGRGESVARDAGEPEGVDEGAA